jgi:hypothetical protein
MHSEVLLEWCIFFLYMFASSLSLRRWHCLNLRSDFRSEGWFWLLLAAILLVFGINKIADMQSVVLDSLKSLAFALHLGQAKMALRKALAGAILGGCLLSAGCLIWRFRNLFRRYCFIPLGLATLAGYYLVRAADFLGFALPTPFASRTWVLEVVGLAILLSVVGRIPIEIVRPPGGAKSERQRQEQE